MALSPRELADEAVVQLRQLALSPGWALYVARLRSLSRSKSGAKAEALRSSALNDALMLQGLQDGLQLAWEELERYTKRLSSGEANLPSGSGQQEE